MKLLDGFPIIEKEVAYQNRFLIYVVWTIERFGSRNEDGTGFLLTSTHEPPTPQH